MEAGGIPPAGSARALRLDPFALPVRYPAKDSGADGQVRQVELDRERVVLRRTLRGMRMKVGLPVSAFRGVVLRLMPAEGDQPAAVTVMLDHNDDALCVPLYAACHTDDVTAIWRAWGRVLSLPLLVVEGDGTLREIFARLGGVGIEVPQPRRRRRSVLRRRRPSILLRRKPGRRIDGARVHHGEREIIARD